MSNKKRGYLISQIVFSSVILALAIFGFIESISSNGNGSLILLTISGSVIFTLMVQSVAGYFINVFGKSSWRKPLHQAFMWILIVVFLVSVIALIYTILAASGSNINYRAFGIVICSFLCFSVPAYIIVTSLLLVRK
ncbi:hypothetical protein [Mycoplasma elephantis]|uniref:hypothetical protein n=1 Tax=Mycoplasma elephantis TaxID=114882 RepID=UPI00048260CE|nr:hypothetical protein [Mycoplasma elephantis]